jgi:hypothetical protein
MEEELEKLKIELQAAFDSGNQDLIITMLRNLKALNIEIPFTVEIQDKPIQQ